MLSNAKKYCNSSCNLITTVQLIDNRLKEIYKLFHPKWFYRTFVSVQIFQKINLLFSMTFSVKMREGRVMHIWGWNETAHLLPSSVRFHIWHDVSPIITDSLVVLFTEKKTFSINNKAVLPLLLNKNPYNSS